MSHEISLRDVQDVFAAMEVETEAPEWNQAQPPRRETAPEPIDRAQEDAEYREFASMLGIADDEPPVKMVSMPREEYEKLKAEADRLPELMRERSRPAEWSAEDERQYRQWARSMGLD
jgi:hypothetical protein